MTYCIEAGLIVEVATDLRDPNTPKLVLRLPGVLGLRDENGKHLFRKFVPAPVETPAGT